MSKIFIRHFIISGILLNFLPVFENLDPPCQTYLDDINMHFFPSTKKNRSRMIFSNKSSLRYHLRSLPLILNYHTQKGYNYTLQFHMCNLFSRLKYTAALVCGEGCSYFLRFNCVCLLKLSPSYAHLN